MLLDVGTAFLYSGRDLAEIGDAVGAAVLDGVGGENVATRSIGRALPAIGLEDVAGLVIDETIGRALITDLAVEGADGYHTGAFLADFGDEFGAADVRRTLAWRRMRNAVKVRSKAVLVMALTIAKLV